MPDHKYNYRVVEDNGGGLHLYVFWGQRVIYAHTGYEYNPGALITDLNALDADTDITGWDGCADDPQGDWDSLYGYDYGWDVVALGGGGKRKLYPHRMGAAAQAEFGVADEQRDQAQAAALIGKRGGLVTSARKAASSAANGRKGGRPRR